MKTTQIEFGHVQPENMSPEEARDWLDAVLNGTAPTEDRTVIGTVTITE